MAGEIDSRQLFLDRYSVIAIHIKSADYWRIRCGYPPNGLFLHKGPGYLMKMDRKGANIKITVITGDCLIEAQYKKAMKYRV